MPVTPTTAFALPDRLAAKADPTLIAADQEHFTAIATTLEESITDLERRLADERRAPGGHGTAALERDQQIHRLTGRLRLLRRFGIDLCLGRMVGADDAEPVYIGRLGLTDTDGRRLLVDWRTPAAEPFFAATHAHPMGLATRRRYRWTLGKITDYWDEVFTPDGLEGHAALDDQSAFIASLGASRTERMRDVLSTIQSDQDAIIRAGSRGALVVDGGPGTGKTVVALHRAAYQLYSDPRLGGDRRDGILFIGPHQPYLAYVSDVLPSLGEEGVQICTLRDLLPESASAVPEPDPDIARLKSSVELVHAVEPAVRFHEQPPTEGLEAETPWADLWVSPTDWLEAFGARDSAASHNEAREQVWDALVQILADKLDPDDDVAPAALSRALQQSDELASAFNRAWPVLDPTDVVADLWSVPAYLRRCAPHLTPDEVRLLQRTDAKAWTDADLPILDAARQLVGDPELVRRKRREDAAVAAELEYRSHVVDHLIESDDSEMQVMSMLRREDLQSRLVDEDALRVQNPDQLAGPFAHVVVDEAQELTDAEWQMVLSRCPSRSLTVVGDRAQARHGFLEQWEDRLHRVGIDTITKATLTINYRTPAEIMAEAEPVIRAAIPDANVPISVRNAGVPVLHAPYEDRDRIIDTWLAEHPDGTACVIGDPSFEAPARVRSLTPGSAKGLEFDLVVLACDAASRPSLAVAVDTYVAMTRATERLVILIPGTRSSSSA